MDLLAPVTAAEDLAKLGNGRIQTVRKTADQSFTNGAVASNDNHLILPAEANATYLVRLFLRVKGNTTGSFRWNFALPSGAALGHKGSVAPAHFSGAPTTMNVLFAIIDESTASTDYGITLPAASGTPVPVVCMINTHVVMGSTAGDLQFKWAQFQTNGVATTLSTGSWMKTIRVV